MDRSNLSIVVSRPVRERLLSAAGCLVFLVLPPSAHAGIFAQSGYEAGKDGVLLLTEKCAPDASSELKVAVSRIGGKVLEGCYVINNRGNAIVKWNDGSIKELDSKIFDKKNLLSPASSGNSEAWLFGSGEAKCEQLPGTVDQEFEALSKRWKGHLEILSPPHDSKGQRFFFVVGTDSEGRKHPFMVNDSKRACMANDDGSEGPAGKRK